MQSHHLGATLRDLHDKFECIKALVFFLHRISDLDKPIRELRQVVDKGCKQYLQNVIVPAVAKVCRWAFVQSAC